MTQGRGRQLTYSALNRLQEVRLENAMRVEYGYGAFGERLFKRVTDSAGTTTKTTSFIGNYLEIEEGLLIHNIYVEDRLIATIGEVNIGTTVSQVSPLWHWEQQLLQRSVYVPTFVGFLGFLFVGAGWGLSPSLGTVPRRRRRVPLFAWGQISHLRPVPRRGRGGRRSRSTRRIATFLVLTLACPSTAIAYVFPSDVEDTWPRPTAAFFLYLHTDHLRSSNLMTEGLRQSTHNGIRFIKGEVVQRVEYTPFGKERYILNPTLRQTPKFTDQVYDVEDGLYFYQSRYYDAVVGRFLQPDSWPPETSNPQTVNAYSYVINNPLKYIDPTGQVIYIPIDQDRFGRPYSEEEIEVFPDREPHDIEIPDLVGDVFVSSGTISEPLSSLSEASLPRRERYIDFTFDRPEAFGLIGIARARVSNFVMNNFNEQTLLRNALIGAVSGVLLGGIAGLVILPGVGVLGGVIVGSVAGFFTAFVGSFYVRQFVQDPASFFYPFYDPRTSPTPDANGNGIADILEEK